MLISNSRFILNSISPYYSTVHTFIVVVNLVRVLDCIRFNLSLIDCANREKRNPMFPDISMKDKIVGYLLDLFHKYSMRISQNVRD